MNGFFAHGMYRLPSGNVKGILSHGYTPQEASDNGVLLIKKFCQENNIDYSKVNTIHYSQQLTESELGQVRDDFRDYQLKFFRQWLGIDEA